jgi:hypothetical protein
VSNPIIFYSWQSDLPRRTTRDLIQEAAAKAVAGLATIEESPRLDHDTQGEAGTPAIAETIFEKIARSAVFLGDASFVGETKPKQGKGKRLPNPNMLLELGYAAATIGWDRVVMVMNTKYGSAPSLPFDLRARRFPITFEVSETETDLAPQIDELAARITEAIHLCLGQELETANRAIARMTQFQVWLLREYGEAGFREENAEHSVFSRLEFALDGLLRLGVIQGSRVTDAGLEYRLTHLGRECLRLLRDGGWAKAAK